MEKHWGLWEPRKGKEHGGLPGGREGELHSGQKRQGEHSGQREQPGLGFRGQLELLEM